MFLAKKIHNDECNITMLIVISQFMPSHLSHLLELYPRLENFVIVSINLKERYQIQTEKRSTKVGSPEIAEIDRD
jgi:hypothetical protein